MSMYMWECLAARGVDITYSDINLTLIDPTDDAPAEEREMTLVTPAYNIISAAVSNSAAYDLIYSGNADGKLSVQQLMAAQLYLIGGYCRYKSYHAGIFDRGK